ncbi:Uncharacterized conserved protein, DUF885 familyt [Austwickia chelonae]|uniref:DUF885 domain-containing protein n=1 Tax=Austwickia chelonae NBRC 105200 TaxID=1184607 RepID=K6V3T1_9MICO|nr:DUF885 domain-containing protein [Austwickia chelonae]GAB76768.1 hypothetical protein AUCHE_02_01300 [Austwickia chelonae NBRC 105200]SEW30422.1 Uncharacterized conserved protein, DUF885 familyt [Austwickia chelonae]
MIHSTSSPRPTTEVDRIAEEYVDKVIELSPLTATQFGIPGEHDGYDDFSPEGWAALADLRRHTLGALDRAACQDDVDRVTVDAMRERLGLEEEIHDADLDLAEMNNLASPMQAIRDVLDLMPTSTGEELAVLARRMGHIPDALDQWHISVREAASRGRTPVRRQVETCLGQARELAGDNGYFATVAALAGEDDRIRGLLAEGAREARRGYGELAEKLSALLPGATERDAVGPETYALVSRHFLGAAVDLAETYAWGQEELARIDALMHRVAGQVRDGASPAEAADLLDDDPRYRLEGTDALQAWMQERADAAIDALAGTHFDIPDPVRRIECRIAPTQTGGIYYTGPSDDFSRPGRMWWSVPKGVTTFGTWRELTTVYHEGVPGHHLQVGQTVYRSDLLNRWRRLMSWTSGHGEGWALYAERLMEELGFLDDPGNLLGMLDGQSMRAARVVLDIGLHCEFEAPAEVGGGSWDYDKAWAFLQRHANMQESFLRFELDRYLGWPGQAPSYKVGERIWLQLREEVRRREADAFDLKAFHRRALDIGGVGLDVFRRTVLA